MSSDITTPKGRTMKTEQQLEEMAQSFSLSQHLTEWDESLTYGEVIEILEEGNHHSDERILVWETYSDWEGVSISNEIENVTMSVLALLKEVQA